MRAKIYLTAFIPKEMSFDDFDIEWGALEGATVHEDVRYKSLSSSLHDIDFDDLGDAILYYCKTIEIPNLSGNSSEITSYIQVVPESSFEDGNDLRVYLSSELLSLLGNRGVAIDIHSQ